MAVQPLPEKVQPKPVPHAERLLLDEQAAAEMLSISVQTLDKLPILRVNLPGTRCKRYRMVDLESYVRGLTQP
jgi:hypothetical protein